jgi:putative membrane-bound dehydrogenase-like protein
MILRVEDVPEKIGRVIAGLLLTVSLVDGASGFEPPGASAPLSPAEAIRRMKVPEGFTVSLFAAEPDVVQPIAMTIDTRGRLWVVENYSYPIWLGGPRGRDRVLIFEDLDNDGRFDRRKIFYDKGTNFTGIEVGFGGVWVCATPSLLFFPDRDSDDRPDSAPVVELDGWSTEAQHNMFNGLKWGPDGWLWGCNGILATSTVGKPGTPENRRVAINCGVWRYHPTREVFEAVAHGTTNPWGLDFDEVGEAFITNCVIPHLFHVIPGAHFQRMYGEDLAPYRYALMETCADHLHWAGGRWQDSREGKGKHGEAGGGHAHVGAMIYQGDNWPARYRGGIYMCNIHGRRINQDRLERSGSTYVGRHEHDFLMAHDPWFRGLELKYGPDGSVYLTDWYDTGECHETDADNAHRENGRIYKIRFGAVQPAGVDLSALSEEALAQLQLHQNDWYVRTARRVLQERAAAGRDLRGAHRVLRDILIAHNEPTRKLRALWALFVTGGTDETALHGLLDNASEHVRAWAVRLLCDQGSPSAATLARFVAMAGSESSPKVRLSLASALQRVPVNLRWRLAEPLTSHAEDAADRAIPFVIWYGVEPAVVRDLSRSLHVAARCRIPLVRQFVARRAVEADPATALPLVVAAMKGVPDADCADLLAGTVNAVRGRKKLAQPKNWAIASSDLMARRDPLLVEQGLLLALCFGEPKAIATLRLMVRDRSRPADLRERVLSALAERHVPGLSADLFELLDDARLRGPALRALAAYDDPTTPEIVLKRYGEFAPSERDDAIATLAARPASALALLAAIQRGQVSRRDVNATIARQLQAFGDPRISEMLETVWGKIAPRSRQKSREIARYKAILAQDAGQAPDTTRGRAVFNRTCLQCHRLYDTGGDVGPELTGSDRANPDYVLENVLDPSTAVSRDYALTHVETRDGRLISGILREQSPTALTIQTPNERLILSREDVYAIKASASSMMPEGLLEPLSHQEVRDLFAYLASTAQVPLP